MAKILSKSQMTNDVYNSFLISPKFGRKSSGLRAAIREEFDNAPFRMQIQVELKKTEKLTGFSGLPYKVLFRTKKQLLNGSKIIQFVKAPL
jgi:hypothetical protein